MDLDKFDVILDMGEKDFAEKLRKAMGLKPGDTLNITGPQFERTDGRIIAYLPNTPEEYEAIKKLDADSLKKVGCQKWDEENGEITWLFPKEWYDHIPDGTKVIDICGKVKEFKHGETSDDIRFGALAYGFKQKVH